MQQPSRGILLWHYSQTHLEPSGPAEGSLPPVASPTDPPWPAGLSWCLAVLGLLLHTGCADGSRVANRCPLLLFVSGEWFVKLQGGTTVTRRESTVFSFCLSSDMMIMALFSLCVWISSSLPMTEVGLVWLSQKLPLCSVAQTVLSLVLMMLFIIRHSSLQTGKLRHWIMMDGCTLSTQWGIKPQKAVITQRHSSPLCSLLMVHWVVHCGAKSWTQWPLWVPSSLGCSMILWLVWGGKMFLLV